jgi:hypothetical protein
MGEGGRELQAPETGGVIERLPARRVRSKKAMGACLEFRKGAQLRDSQL